MSTAQRAPHSGAVMLDESLLHEVKRVLSASGIAECRAFVLIELNDAGLRTSVVDASTGASLVERGDGKLCPRMLDLAMADHLVRAGRVQRPSSFDWATELIDLMPDVRSRLAVTDGAFAMGREHVAMFRVSRRDYYAGLQQHLVAAQTLWQSVAFNSEPPVGALVFMPEHEQWPGLYPTLSHLAPIPAVALTDPALTDPALTDPAQVEAAESEVAVSDVAESDVAVSDVAEADVVATPRDQALPELIAAPDTREPAVPGVVVVAPAAVDSEALDSSALNPSALNPSGLNPSGLDPATPVFDRAVFDTAVYGQRLVAPATPAPAGPSVEVIPAPAAPPAHAVEQPDVPLPLPGVALPGAGSPPGTYPPGPYPTGAYLPDPSPQALFRATGEQDVYAPVEFTERTPISVHDHREVMRSVGPRHYTPPAPQSRVSGVERRQQHRRVLIGVTAVAAAAVAGALIIVLPWMGGGAERTASTSPQGVAQTSSVPASPGNGSVGNGSAGNGSAGTGSRPPLDLRGAQAPVLRYTPPPPPTATQQQARPNTPSRRAAPPPPRRRSIPNPIPGLPPILLP